MFFKDLVGFNRLDLQTASEDDGVGKVLGCGFRIFSKLRKNFPFSTFNFPLKEVGQALPDNRGKYNLDS